MSSKKTRRRLVSSEVKGSVEGALRRRSRKRKPVVTAKKKTTTKKVAQVRARKKTDELVAPMLSRNPPRQRQRDASGYLHVSDLVHGCVRALAIAEHVSQPHMSEPVFEGMGLVYAQGHSIQEHMTQRLVANVPEKIYGEWKCACGRTEFAGTYEEAAEEQCDTCETKLDQYQELTLRNDEYMLVGNVDLRLIEHNRFHFTEVKTITNVNKQFDELRRPQPDHTVQILLYWWMAREAGMLLWDSVSVVYANKNFMMGTPYKEFVLTPSSMIDRLDDYLEEAKDLATYRETKALADIPVRTQCASITSPGAKKCQFANTCFNMDS